MLIAMLYKVVQLFLNLSCLQIYQARYDRNQRGKKQAEAEVVPSSSLVEVEVEVALGVEVGVEVQPKFSYIKLG